MAGCLRSTRASHPRLAGPRLWHRAVKSFKRDERNSFTFARHVWSKAAHPRRKESIGVDAPTSDESSHDDLHQPFRAAHVNPTAILDSMDTKHEAVYVPQSAQRAVHDTSEFPARYKVVLVCMLAFVICNMDKVNMSVAIIPMAKEFGWSPSVVGVVQSAFFYGYMASQIPSGYLANKLSGRVVLPGGVVMWSAFTAAVPLLCSSIGSLCVSRAAVGFAEGVGPSAVNDIVVKAVPKNERARAISTIFGGLHVGSIAGLLLAPLLITRFGWPMVFVVFGALGIVWWALFEGVLRDTSDEMSQMRDQLRSDEAISGMASTVPYRAFLRNGPVRALMFTHFANNWFHYTMLAWLPTYFTSTLSLGVTEASTVSLFPSIAAVLVASVSGQLADRLVESGVPLRRVRTLAQSTAFVLPALCLGLAAMSEGSQASIGFISAALGLNAFALSGLYCTHQDMSPKYAGPLLGLTNTSGAIPGIIGVAVVGVLFDRTHSWSFSLLAPCCLFFLLGAAVYAVAASSDPQDFSDNEPFAWERELSRLFGSVGD
jgi:MFS transporter, ACS family, solute carrier family 17 (sodium-dependent inorganic phosphate cotransporter), other